MPRPAMTALFALLFSVSFAQAETTVIGDIHITDQWARESPKRAKAGAAYLTIRNAGAEDDALLGVSADFPRVMLHGTKKEDGVMKMHHVHVLPVAAGETVALEPGGYHIMFMGLDDEGLRAGEAVEATLTFENAGEVVVSFPVKPLD